MNLVGSLQTLMQTYGSSTVILVAWLAFLALAVLVFLVLIIGGAHHPGRSPHRRGADSRASFWQQGMPQPPGGSHHSQERHLHERR
jgi:hypothetical protein